MSSLKSRTVVGDRRSKRDERALVAAARTGDPDAFTALVERHEARMRRLARSVVGSPETAEDVVQDTWLAVLLGIDGFEGRSSLRSWLLSIVLNRARSRVRRERRTVPFSALAADDGGYAAGERPSARHVGNGHGSGMTPHEMFETRSLHASLVRAVAALPTRQRAVLTLRDIRGLSGPEACEALGMSSANQRTLLHQARRRVASAISTDTSLAA